MKIGMTSVFVSDPVSAFKFFTGVLGFIEKLFVPDQWLSIIKSPEDPEGASLMLEPNHNAMAKRFQQGLYKAGIPIIVFNTGDIEKEYSGLTSLGVRFRKNQPEPNMVLRRCLKMDSEISSSLWRNDLCFVDDLMFY